MKLLVLSHNPVSRHNAMGKTIGAFLSEMKPEEVCQLYIYPASPCRGVCSSFYRVTDREVLKSFLGFGLPGRSLKDGNIGNDVPNAAAGRHRKKGCLFRLARDIMWCCPGWFNSRLKNWIEQEKPDCIFAAGGDGAFLYRIALKLSREYGLPIVAYLCDEYYFLPPEKTLAGRLWQACRKRKMEEFLDKASYAVVISPEMHQSYARQFSVPVSTIMTGSSGPIANRPCVSEQVTQLTYMGNLGYGRYRSLVAIGKALMEINRKYGAKILLEVYSAQKDPEAEAALASVPTIRFRGFLSSQEVGAVMGQAQLLVHVEDFAPDHAELVKHSVSTKIPDSLASGVPLFAYGPKQTASMAYLLRNCCSVAAVSEEMLEQMLTEALFDKNRRSQAAENGLKAARQNHNRMINSRKLRVILENAVTEGKLDHETTC